jgi:hypothetical protein
MHFQLNLLRIKNLYMFRTLLAHPQEALHKLHLVYCVRMSAGCATNAVQCNAFVAQPAVCLFIHIRGTTRLPLDGFILKFDFWVFFENLSREFKTLLKYDINRGTLHENKWRLFFLYSITRWLMCLLCCTNYLGL